MSKEWLTIRLGSKGDGINADAVLEALHSTIAALKEIDKERSRFGSETIEWRISDAGKNSPFFAQITGLDLVNSNGNASDVFADFTDGLRHLEANNTCPQNFNERSLRHVYDLANLSPKGVELIQYETSKHVVLASRDTVQHAKKAISMIGLEKNKRGKTYREFGTMEGRLKGIAEMAAQRRDQFTIVDAITKHETICYFTGSKLENQVRDSWKHRVAVSGEITVNRDTGAPVSMKVEEIRRLRERGELPQPQDIDHLEINITNGMESSEYVRGLRDAE